MTYPTFPSQNRPDRAVIALTGEGVLAFLDNLLTCDCGALAERAAAYGALLTPQGKILHDMFVFNAGERVLVDCAASQRNALLQRLVIYRLRAKIQITLDNDLEVGVHMEQPGEGMHYADPRVAAMGHRSFDMAGSLINTPSSTAYDERRILLGVADSDRDIGSEQTFPHEANFDQMNAVSFTKGCYVGQEVVSRMQHRGTARNRMLPVSFEGTLISGSAITSDSIQIGTILSTFRNHALAMIRLDRLAEARAPLIANDIALHVEKPGWIGYEVPA